MKKRYEFLCAVCQQVNPARDIRTVDYQVDGGAVLTHKICVVCLDDPPEGVRILSVSDVDGEPLILPDPNRPSSGELLTRRLEEARRLK